MRTPFLAVAGLTVFVAGSAYTIVNREALAASPAVVRYVFVPFGMAVAALVLFFLLGLALYVLDLASPARKSAKPQSEQDLTHAGR